MSKPIQQYRRRTAKHRRSRSTGRRVFAGGIAAGLAVFLVVASCTRRGPREDPGGPVAQQKGAGRSPTPSPGTALRAASDRATSAEPDVASVEKPRIVARSAASLQPQAAAGDGEPKQAEIPLDPIPSHGPESTIEIATCEVAGMSQFRAHWDTPLMLSADARVEVRDKEVTDRGGTANWSAKAAENPIALDALNRTVLVRFPDAAERIAKEVRQGKAIKRVEVVLPFVDEELWPPGTPDWPGPEGYNYRMNWDVDKMWRAHRPKWHAVAWALRKPWHADPEDGPTLNAAINGALHWAQWGARDTARDRYPKRFGPTPVNHASPEGRMDVSSLLRSPTYGRNLAARLRSFADCGLMLRKWETYDHHYFNGCYEWATATGGRGIRIGKPRLVVTLVPGRGGLGEMPGPADIRALAAKHRAAGTGGRPSATLPSDEQLESWAREAAARPAWMSDVAWKRVQQLSSLEGKAGFDEPVWHQFVFNHVLNKQRGIARSKGLTEAGLRRNVYLAWIDKLIARPPRGWSGFESARAITEWRYARKILPGPASETIDRYWTAWLMPDRPTAPGSYRRGHPAYEGGLVHPMADDPRVGGKGNPQPAKGKFDSYVAATGDWRGNKSFFRSGFCYDMSTQNFNFTATAGALLAGSMIGSEFAIADGRHGLENWPLRQWSWSTGSTQEHIDHYYFAITLSGAKAMVDHAPTAFDRLMAESVLAKQMEELVSSYHPGLKRFVAGSARSNLQHLLGTQDGLQFIVHTMSKRGALLDPGAATLPEGMPNWGHETPAAQIAMQTLTGPWAQPWQADAFDEKALPFSAVHRTGGTWRSCHMGENYGLASRSDGGGRFSAVGFWRHRDREVESMRDITTMDIRYGCNTTNWVCKGGGWIPPIGSQVNFQDGGTLLTVMSPAVYQGGIAGGGYRDDIASLQSSVALFNYEEGGPSWKVYVGATRVTELPFESTTFETITIDHGATYAAIVPFATEVKRAAALTLHRGEPQESAHTKRTHAAALVINAHNLLIRPTSGGPLSRDSELWYEADKSYGGFVVKIADAREHASFAAFQRAARAWRLRHLFDEGTFAATVEFDDRVHAYELATPTSHKKSGGTWKSPGAQIARRTRDGSDPYDRPGVWRDTPLTSIVVGRVEKKGAVVESVDIGGNRKPVSLHVSPRGGTFVAWNPLPDRVMWCLESPRISVSADGAIGLARIVAYGNANAVEIDHWYKPGTTSSTDATAFAIRTDGQRPTVYHNGKEASSHLVHVTLGAGTAWALPLKDGFDAAGFPSRHADARSASEHLLGGAGGEARKHLIQDWYICGGFADGGKDSAVFHRAVYGPERGPVDLAATYETPGGTRVGWTRIDEGIVEFGRHLTPKEYNVAYAYTEVTADRARRVTMLIGSDDQVKVWLNGELVHDHPEDRPCVRDQDRVPVSLSAGRNTILMKVSQGFGGWAGCLRFGDRWGRPAKGIAVSVE